MSEIKTDKISSLTGTNNDITIDPDGTGNTVIASGNVGIGTALPTAKLHISGNASNASALSDTVTDFALRFESATTTNYFSNAICFAEGTNVNASIASFDGGSGGAQGLVFGTGASNTERMRINSSGTLLVGKTSDTTTTEGHVLGYSGYLHTTRSGAVAHILNRTTSNGIVVQYRRDNTAVGSVSVTTSATTYSTSSDYRLKENVVADWDATTRLKQLNPVRFNFIADADTTVDGFLAHEVQDVVPEAITGTKDEIDEDGNPVMQGIDQSKIVPLLVKTIQELEARITALETE